MSVVRPLFGHTSPETAYLIADYPYGRKLRCQRRVWVNYSPRHGYCFVAQTTNPKTGRWNKEHKGTYHEVAMALYLDEQEHVQSMAVGTYGDASHALAFAKSFGRQCEGADSLRVWALKKAEFSRKLATGEAYFTINGQPCEPSQSDISENLSESAQWLEVASLLDPARMGETGT